LLVSAAVILKPNQKGAREIQETETFQTPNPPASKDLSEVADLIIYGKLVTRSEGSGYYWQTVEVQKVITNRTAIVISRSIEVAHTLDEFDLPRTNALLYLQKYSSSNYWRALGLPKYDFRREVQPAGKIDL
jgi:hypothetical protein